MDVWTAPVTCHDTCVWHAREIFFSTKVKVFPFSSQLWMRTSSGSLQFSGSRQVLMRRDRAGSWDTFPWFSEDSQDLIPAKCQWKCPSYLFFLVVSVLMPVAPLMRMQSFLIWKERVNVMGSCDDEVWWRLMIFLSHLFWSLCEWIYE